MSMVTELIAAVTAAERQIDDQIMKLTSFNDEIDNAVRQIDEAFGGSVKSYDQNIDAQLTATKEKLNGTVRQLESAKRKLQLVRMV